MLFSAKFPSARDSVKRSSMQPLTGVLQGGNHRGMAVRNSLHVLESICRREVTTQRQIVQSLGMQSSTVSNIIRELKAAGLVREAGMIETGGVGARQVSLEINSSFAWAAGWQINLKGHQLCLLDAAGHIMVMKKFPLDLSWQEISEKIPGDILTLAAAKRLSMKQFAGLGISVQGIVDRSRGEVIYSQPHEMRAVPLAKIIGRHLCAPVHVERDVPCGAYLEQYVTAKRNKSFLYYLLRRHERFFEHAAGIVLHGEVFRGSHSAAGELTEKFFPRPRPSQIHTEKDWDAVYRSFGASVATLADFLDVDGVIVSSDDPGMTDRRFQLLQDSIYSCIRPIKGRQIEITRSQAGPEGMLLGAGLIALHHHFQQFVLALPNRSLSAKGKKSPAPAA